MGFPFSSHDNARIHQSQQIIQHLPRLHHHHHQIQTGYLHWRKFEVGQPAQQQQKAAAVAVPQDTAPATADTHMQAAKVLGLAQEMADRLTSEDQAESKSMLDEARAAAEAQLADADQKSQAQLADAKKRADQQVTEADTRAKSLVADAEKRAEETTNQANSRAEAQIRQAEEKANAL